MRRGMEVTVKMYPEEYDLFREYQREKPLSNEK